MTILKQKYMRLASLLLLIFLMSFTPTKSSTKESLCKVNALPEGEKLIKYNNFVLVNIPHWGWVIHNVANLKKPILHGMIAVVGSTDAVIKDGVFYTQNQDDLVALDIGQNLDKADEIARKKDLFKKNDRGSGKRGDIRFIPAPGSTLFYTNLGETPIESTNKVTIRNWFKSSFLEWNDGIDTEKLTIAGEGGSSSQGSMSSFTLSGNTLFSIDSERLHIINIKNTKRDKKIAKSEKITIAKDIETTYITDSDKLFIGAQSAFYIYDIKNPKDIKMISKYNHRISCDPVVANQTHAYVTLNSDCINGEGNVLQVIELRNNAQNPTKIATQKLQSPKGLALDDKNHLLYICDKNRLAVYDVSTPNEPTFLQGIKVDNAFDVLIDGGQLFVSGKEGSETKVHIFDANFYGNGGANKISNFEFEEKGIIAM